MAQAVASDLATSDVALRGLVMLFPGPDPKPVVEELTARLSEELDYTIAVENQ